MPNLLLKFYVFLDQQRNWRKYDGPLFHRWLPDGEKDAIDLYTGFQNTRLKVWFERRGYVEDGVIRFDITRNEVDLAIIPTQAAHYAGSLFGLLEVQDITDGEAGCLSNQLTEDPVYLALCETVVDKIIQPCVSRFIDILRTKYGQYWIREPEGLDYKKRSLNNRCYLLRLQGNLDSGMTWLNLTPNAATARTNVTAIIGTKESFQQYLTRKDWEDLADLGRKAFNPPLGAFILSRARQLFEEENYKYALIEGVLALEISLAYFIKKNFSEHSNPTRSELQNILHLEDQLSVIAKSVVLPKNHLKLAIQAIRIRNKTVHEYHFPDEQVKPKIKALLTVVAVLNFGQGFKLPSPHLGNMILPVEDWEEQ
jgi:hypothetical protein